MTTTTFIVRVRREGVTTEFAVVAACWFEAWSAALDEHGLGCRIEVEPAAAEPA